MSGRGFGSGGNAPGGVAGKIFTSLFFLIFLGMGAVFLWLLLREEVGAARTWTWQKTPCEILSSRVEDPGQQGRKTSSFYFEVTYRYQFGDQTFTCDRYQRKPAAFGDYRKVAQLVDRYPSGSAASCYVNPSAPEEAVLARDNFYLLPFVLLPLMFIAIGGGSIYYTWRVRPAREPSAESISERAEPAKRERTTVIVCSLFLLVGSLVLCVFFLWPLLQIVLARDWPAVPCVVVSSEVVTHRGSKSSSYSVNILYRYQSNGREFKSNRYDFMGGSSGGRSRLSAVVRQHPPGRNTVCYVNPNDPTEAVLERGFTPELWFGLIPLGLMVIGALLLIVTLRSPGAGQVGAGAGRSTETLVLKPKTAPWLRLVGIVFMALFWNGIVSVFLVQALHGWRTGHGEWLLTLFMVPFVGVGLGLVGGIVYGLLALFNPRPHLRVTPGAVPLGGEVRVEWELSGRTGVLRKLELRLQGREEAEYRRGKNTSTDTHVFADIELATLSNAYEMRSGARTVRIPEGLMHSFAGKSNRIVWLVRVNGEIPRWPDVKEEFPIIVLPAVRTAREVG